MRANWKIAGAAFALLAVSACNQAETGPAKLAEADASSSGTVASAISNAEGMQTLKTALSDTQLSPVLDGKGDYTLLAPGDAAFTALGEKGKALSEADKRPVLAAVLRGHILPGVVTPDAILAAIDRKKAPVQMMTMDGKPVSFNRNGEKLVVGNGKVTATVDGTGISASNGAVLSIDRVLLP